MFSRIRPMALLAAALTLTTFGAQAATFTYDLFNHPDGSLTDHKYGLRLDKDGKLFSFENASGGSLATLVYDDVAATATISGDMLESLGGGALGSTLWSISYAMSGVTDVVSDGAIVSTAGDGFFVDTTGLGSGTLDDGTTTLTLGAKSAGSYFFLLLDDGHRLGGHSVPAGTKAGRGWVNTPGAGCCNDFLFTARLSGSPPGPDPVPLPAAGWLLIGALAGLRIMTTRRRAG